MLRRGDGVNRAELDQASIASHQMSEGKLTSRQFQVPPVGTLGLHKFELLLLLLIIEAIILLGA